MNAISESVYCNLGRYGNSLLIRNFIYGVLRTSKVSNPVMTYVSSHKHWTCRYKRPNDFINVNRTNKYADTTYYHLRSCVACYISNQ